MSDLYHQPAKLSTLILAIRMGFSVERHPVHGLLFIAVAIILDHDDMTRFRARTIVWNEDQFTRAAYNPKGSYMPERNDFVRWGESEELRQTIRGLLEQYHYRNLSFDGNGKVICYL